MVVETYSYVHVLEMEGATDDVPYTVHCTYTNNNHDCYIQFQIIKNKCAAGIYAPIFQFVNCRIFFVFPCSSFLATYTSLVYLASLQKYSWVYHSVYNYLYDVCICGYNGDSTQPHIIKTHYTMPDKERSETR